MSGPRDSLSGLRAGVTATAIHTFVLSSSEPAPTSTEPHRRSGCPGSAHFSHPPTGNPGAGPDAIDSACGELLQPDSAITTAVTRTDAQRVTRGTWKGAPR